MTKNLLLTLLLIFPVTAFADDAKKDSEPAKATSQEEPQETPAEKRVLQIRLGADTTNQYFFRGIRQEDQGFIGQPWAELKLSFYSNSWLTDIRAVVGTWNSFHSGPTGSQSNADTPASWYETRFYAGAEADFFKHITLSGGYTIYTSPNDSLETVHEFYIKLAVNDYYVWHDLAPEDLIARGETVIWNGINPHGMMAFEASGQRDNGLNNGVYAEVGIRPSWTLNPGLVFTVAAPVKVGFSVDQYYELPITNPGNLPQDDAFGFTDIGLEGNLPFPCLGEKWGRLSLNVGGHWLYLGQNLSKTNGNDKHVGIATAGILYEY